MTSQSVVALTLYADRLLTATFETYTDTLAVSSVGNGHVVVSPSAPAYARGSSVRLTAMSDPGSHFVSWCGDTSSVANPLTLVMRDKTTVVATFAGNDPNVALPDGFISQEIVEGLDQPVGMAFLPILAGPCSRDLDNTFPIVSRTFRRVCRRRRSTPTIDKTSPQP